MDGDERETEASSAAVVVREVAGGALVFFLHWSRGQFISLAPGANISCYSSVYAWLLTVSLIVISDQTACLPVEHNYTKS